MRGRLLLYTIIFVFMTLLGLITLVVGLVDKSLVFADLGNPLALMAVTWPSVVMELGRRRHGHVRAGWTVSVVALAALALTVNLTIVMTANQGVLRTLVTALLIGAIVLISVGVTVENFRNRLGLPVRQRVPPSSRQLSERACQ